MTAAIVETLAKEFSIRKEHAARLLELLQAGYKPPYLARYRRAEVGELADHAIRRVARRLKQFEELEARRGTLLRSIQEQQARNGAKDVAIPQAVLSCTDRFELEDHFLPFRRPEPEVQLAIDRGLEPLADALVATAPKGTPGLTEETDEREGDEASGAEASASEETAAAPGEHAPSGASSASAGAVAESPAPLEEAAAPAEPEASGEGAHDPDPDHESAETLEAESALAAHDAEQDAPGESREGEPATARPPADEAPAREDARSRPVFHPAAIALSPQLARVCAQYVDTDRGVHTEQQALDGAMRILSDRLGRNPELRTLLRRLLRKHGRVGVRPLVEEARLGRNRALLRLSVPLRQLQGHRLIALRQAQAARQVALVLSVEESVVLPKVRAALGRRIHPDYVTVANEVARQALYLRLLPMIEDDVRNELRERADEEALRLVGQHLRQILLTPAAGPRPVAGVHVDAKGDWIVVVVGPDGAVQGAPLAFEASTLPLAELAQKLNDSMRGTGVGVLAAGNGKGSRAGVQKLREALKLLDVDAAVVVVNEAGLSNYASSELARGELPELTAPAREAVSLARRYQDPLQELLKLDPRHLGLGREQLIAGKAAVRRLVHDVVEACVAHVGCDLNRAPVSFLRHVPGLTFEAARALVERRAQRPFASREELRTESLLDDLSWVNAIGFLRVRDSSEPLDATALHPEQYDLARRVILQGGASVEETLGRRDAAKGLRRADFDVDEGTWRDLVREISYPGRDPRPRQFVPRFVAPDTDPKTLAKDQVIEGIVSNVASFGAFVDIGLAKDAMVHISEISDHYVRDARALLSIGQLVRARVVTMTGPRVELSLKNVPDFRRSQGARPGRDARSAEAGGEGGAVPARRGGRRPRGQEAWPEREPVLRAARSRRDGLVTGRRGDDRRRGSDDKGGDRGPRRSGPPRARGPGEREEYDADAVRRASRGTGTYNPFASFFKGKKPGGEPEPPQAASPEAPPAV